MDKQKNPSNVSDKDNVVKLAVNKSASGKTASTAEVILISVTLSDKENRLPLPGWDASLSPGYLQ